MRCICCNKMLNDREIHLKDTQGQFRDTCYTCLPWILDGVSNDEDSCYTDGIEEPDEGMEL